MLRWIILILGIALMLSSCCRNLLTDITLSIDDSSMNFYIGSNSDDEDYFFPSDSARVRQDVKSDLVSYFNEKGNDVTVVSNGTYTLRILSCSFYEGFTNASVLDPCDTIAPYDTLHYEVHALSVRMRCILTDSSGHYSEIIEAESSDEEKVKNHPTFFQSLFGHDDCYCPRVSNIHFVNKLQRRVLRRIHRQSMCQIKSWQRMEM